MDTIKIGKNVIENLTTGMYSESKIIYREYIQNVADQIDKAIQMEMFPEDDLHIDIVIDSNTRTVRIRDNATGIPNAEVAKKLAYVADSEKEKGVDKGFRGIGRLGGLAYCDTLKFITSYQGEKIKTTMIWNAKELIRLLEDSSVKDSAEDVLRRVISYVEEPCNEAEHFFTVELNGIRKENNELLDIVQVRKYIASNTPVPYNNKFIYRSKIYNYMKENNLPINEYKVFVDGEIALKDYSTVLYDNNSGQKRKYDEVFDVQICEYKNDYGDLLAWMWYGISSFEKQIPESVNEMRGIRLRQANIQLGDSHTLENLFKEKRGNFYFIGEVHTAHKDLIPNARRDYFNENETRNELETKLRYYFANTLNRLYYDANSAKNAFKKDIGFREKQNEYQQKAKTAFVDEREKLKIEHELEQKKAENDKAQKTIDKLKIKTADNEPFGKVLKAIEKKYKRKIQEEGLENEKSDRNTSNKQTNKKITFVVDDLSKLNAKQRKLVSKIYSVINEVLPPDLSENLIKKIQDELNK